MKKEERNYLTEENGAKIIQVTSEMSGCNVANILLSETKAIWLSEEGIPQEIVIDISTLITKPLSIKALGVYCWHAYPSNPKLIELLYSNNNKNYNSLGNFDLCIKSGTQVFDLDSLLLKSINFIKIVIKETFGGNRTYLNNVYMYENLPNKDSSVISVRESRESNMPRLMTTTTTPAIASSLKKDLLSREFADDLLDMKSKDDTSNIVTQKNVLVSTSIITKNDNILLSSDNQMLISDSDLSEKIPYPKAKEQEAFTSRIMEEEDEDKEKSSAYGSMKKQSGSNNNNNGNEMNKIISNKLQESSVALENDDMEIQLRESNTSYNRINTTNDIKQDYHQIEPEFNDNNTHHQNNINSNNNNSNAQKIFNLIKQKELFKSTDTNQLDSVQLNNPNLLSNYINTITNSVEDIRENTEGNYPNNTNYQCYHNDNVKYNQVDSRLNSLEKDIGVIKDQLDRISQNIETIVEAQNNLNESTYGYILEECKMMIDLRIGNALTNLNLYRNEDHNNIDMINNNNNYRNNTYRDVIHNRIPSSTLSSARKRQTYTINSNVANISYDRSDSKNRRNNSYNEINHSSFQQHENGEDNNNTNINPNNLFQFEKNLDNKLEEKFMNFSNQLGQKITDTLLKPSINQLENFMKGNLTEMKLHLRNAEKKSKVQKNQHQETKTLRKEQQLTALLDKLQDKLEDEEKKEYHNLPLKVNNNHYVQYSNNNNSQSNKHNHTSNSTPSQKFNEGS